MTAIIEFYDEQGNVILGSNTKILVALQDELFIPTVNYSNGAVQGWNGYWDVNKWEDAQTGATSTAGYLAYWMVTGPTIVGAEQSWIALNEGASSMISQNSFGVSNHGAGARIIYTGQANPNKYKGFAEVYDSSGGLLWSVGSLIKSPIIVDVLQLTTAHNSNALQYSVAKHGTFKNRIYFMTAYEGYFDVQQDESYSSQDNKTVIMKRVGDTYYFRPKEFSIPSDMPVTVLVAHIPVY